MIPRKLPSAQPPAHRSTTEQYNAWSSKYDEETASYGWCAHEKVIDVASTIAPPKKGLRVLDIGVGTGLSTEPYVAAQAKVTGLDISPEMLAIIRKKGLRYERLAQYDLANPLSSVGIKPATFDLIISSGTLHFSQDIARTLADANSTLAKGGALSVTYIPPQDRKFGPYTKLNDPAAVAKATQALGLEIVKHEPFTAYREKGDPNDPVRYWVLLARKAS